jgi:4-hydroxy-3-polyprenylbenzoate decarboxylase
LEGYVNLAELRTEGPFGDHTGFYTMEDQYPVFHVTCITHRKDPIYAATVVGKPPMEDAWMGKAVERIFLPLMQLTLPEIVDVCLPPEAVFHNLMIVSIRKSYAGHARKVMNGIWAMGQAMFTKCVIVVDEDCDVQDLAEVTLRVANNIDPERDIQFTLGPVDTLDHASPPAQLRQQDGHRRHPQMGRRRLHPPLARHAQTRPRRRRPHRRPLEETGHRMIWRGSWKYRL